MTERVREVHERIIDDETGERPVRATTGVSVAERVVYFVTGILMTLLAFRVLLSLLGANRGNGFADFIYDTSYPFVAPFFGLFNYDMEYGVSRLEIETLVAMLVYGIVAYGIVYIIRMARREA